MARRKLRVLTDFELEIMRIIWAQEETTVPELQEALRKAGRPVALPTVRTMLGILEEKGYVVRRTGLRRHAYRAAVSARQARSGLLRDIIERAFDGSALSLVAALVDARMVTRKEMQKVRQLIEQTEQEPKK
jgi:predicted transcriptional regulator